MPLRILVFALAGSLLIGGVSVFTNSNTSIYDEKAYLILPEKKIELTVAATSESRTQGLGGLESLPADSAMFFVFNDLDKYGIWMKDMKFPIDIFWLDDKGKIVHLEKDVSPNTYPKVFFPPEKSLYILEANAGFAQKNGLVIGKVLNFSRIMSQK
ncbi:MAG: uncharacterized protein QG640_321 [Patescibacteria group bacterium]|nr:uncharacterized protein [Patescibacteria group bacterium]